MSHWLPMPKETPRTYEAVIETLQRDAKGERGEARRQMALATFASGVHGRDGRLTLSLLRAPWCDGALILLNPDPEIEPADGCTKASIMLRTIEAAFERPRKARLASWQPYGDGFSVDDSVARTGKRSIRCSADRLGMELGISQTVVLNQTEPKPLLVSAWSKAENVSGKPNPDYSVYVDLVYDDGTPHWGLTAEFETGTHDWVKAERVIQPKRPVARATVHLLFRRTHTGTVWFDDAFFGEIGGRNLLSNEGFEELTQGGELDGVYLDSLEMGATALNYRREHWRCADVPLTFDQFGNVCQMLIFAVYEFARWLSERMHAQGKLMFANAALQQFAFPAHLLDVMGVEVNWMRGGKYQPTPDERMTYWRAISYRKPYCLLMNTNYELFTRDLVERYMKRCMFYAIFPSMFDEEAASKDPYWASPKRWYERDRDLFRRYIPIIRTLAQAGWEPITHAWTNDEAVYVERYGNEVEGGLFFTILNDGAEQKSFTLTIDAAPLRLDGEVRLIDILNEHQLPTQRNGNMIIAKLKLPPDDAVALKVTR